MKNRPYVIHKVDGTVPVPSLLLYHCSCQSSRWRPLQAAVAPPARGRAGKTWFPCRRAMAPTRWCPSATPATVSVVQSCHVVLWCICEILAYAMCVYAMLYCLLRHLVRELMDLFRAVLVSGEKTQRVLELTEDILETNAANYTVWRVHYLQGIQCSTCQP